MHVRSSSNTSHSSSAQACPLCDRYLTPEIQTLAAAIEPPVQRRIQAENPGWTPPMGACPECVYKASEANRLERSRTSLQDELLLPYPVYSIDETNLIPVHRQVDASPQYSGAGVTMAFLDSGFYPHPDLTRPENRILCYVDATTTIPEEKEIFNQSLISSWHGLMTASVAAGNGWMSDRLYRGIAYQANLVLVKTGSPLGRGIRSADIQRSLEWVLANQARFNIRVVNISLGGDHTSNGRLTDLDRLVEQAVDSGLVVVTAAGNSGSERLMSPASAPSAITVGGLDDRNSYDRRLWRMYPSNYGHSVGARPKPELIAPATWLAAPMLPRTLIHSEGILLWRLDQTIQRLQQGQAPPAGRAGERSPDQLESIRRKIRLRMIDQKYIHPHYQHVDGTSMAASVVSAVIALMLEANPGLTPAQVKNIMVSTAVPLEALPAEKSGAGLVNAGRAVAAARRAARGVLDRLPFSPHRDAGRLNFYYFDPLNRLATVAVIGSFNAWNPQGYEMSTNSPGLWQLSIPIPPPGRYGYKFLVDDLWVNDPENTERVEDGYGGFNSILEVKE